MLPVPQMQLLGLLLILVMSAPAAERKQLFNGENLDGWRMTGPGEFKVEDGLLATYGGMGLLYFEREKFGNVRLRVIFQTTGGHDNSGVFIRMPELPSDKWYAVHNGYEVQIGTSEDTWTRTGALYSISPATGGWQQKPAGEWNVLEIELRGAETLVHLNGKEVNRYREGQPVPPRQKWTHPVRGPRPDSGYIGLQNHDAKSKVLFREISVEALN
jgi:hypothetical protein